MIRGTVAVLLVAALVTLAGCGSGSGAYPPHSESDLKAIADSSTITLAVVKREQVGIPACDCRLSVIVPPGLSYRRQAAALLKVFYANGLDTKGNNSGGAVVFGYWKKSEVGQGFTAGRVLLDTNSGRAFTVDVEHGIDGKEWKTSG